MPLLLTLAKLEPLETSHITAGMVPAVAGVTLALICRVLPTAKTNVLKLAFGVELALAPVVDVSVLG